jgi:RNA polymerase sigma factor (sigma-70 family)
MYEGGESMTTAIPQQPEPADEVLLTRFTQQGDADAFAALMRRHGPYILGVCRRLTSHTQDAEDVLQACFLELVRKAASIRRGRSVVGWLHSVAVRLGRKATLRRRREQERETAVRRPESVESQPDISWREVCQILEEEIARLPEKLRLPIIVCLFEERTYGQAAKELATTPAAVKSRLQRGRALLRARLIRRGVSGAALATLLAVHTASAALAAPLAERTLAAACAVAQKTALTAAVSPAVAGLLTSSTVPTHWPAVLAGVLALGLCAVAVPLFWPAPPSAPPRPAAVAPPAPPGPRQVRRSFRGHQFDTDLFRYYGPTPERYVRPEEEGLRMTLPAEGGPAEPVGILLRYPVQGDFELDATFDVLDIGAPVKDPAGVTLYLLVDSGDRDGIQLGQLRWSPQVTQIGVSVRINAEGGHGRRYKEGKTLAPGSAEGLVRFHVTRRGSRFAYFAARGGADELEPIDEREVSAANLLMVRLAVDPGWSPGVPVDAHLVDFAMSGTCVGYDPSAPGRPLR